MNPLSRRRFLVAGGVTAGVLATGSALLMRGGGDAHYASLTDGATPRTLSLKEYGVLSAFCRQVCPGDLDTHTARRIDQELTFHTAQMVRDVKSALLLLEHGGVLHLSTTRFTRLTTEAQTKYLERMGIEGNALERQVVGNLKLLALFFHYCDERTWAGIHYDGPFQPRLAPAADSRVR